MSFRLVLFNIVVSLSPTYSKDRLMDVLDFQQQLHEPYQHFLVKDCNDYIVLLFDILLNYIVAIF